MPNYALHTTLFVEAFTGFYLLTLHSLYCIVLYCIVLHSLYCIVLPFLSLFLAPTRLPSTLPGKNWGRTGSFKRGFDAL